jgi:hypothetical protein
MFDTKIAVVVRDDLAVWQKLNVVVFLTSGIVAAVQQYTPAEMNVVGLAVREEKKLVDKITRGAKLHA